MVATVLFLVLAPLAWAGVRAAVRALLRCLLGPPEVGSRRERYANASETVAKGVLPRALAATPVFPTLPNMMLAMYATSVDSKTHAVHAADLLQVAVAEAGVGRAQRALQGWPEDRGASGYLRGFISGCPCLPMARLPFTARVVGPRSAHRDGRLCRWIGRCHGLVDGLPAAGGQVAVAEVPCAGTSRLIVPADA